MRCRFGDLDSVNMSAGMDVVDMSEMDSSVRRVNSFAMSCSQTTENEDLLVSDAWE